MSKEESESELHELLSNDPFAFPSFFSLVYLEVGSGKTVNEFSEVNVSSLVGLGMIPCRIYDDSDTMIKLLPFFFSL